MARHDRGIAPADHHLRHRLAVRGDKARAQRIAEHSSVLGNIGGAPLPQDQMLGLDPGQLGCGSVAPCFRDGISCTLINFRL